VAAPHCEFSVICVAHSVLLLPRLAFDSFLLVTDPRLTGHRTVAYRPPVLLARTVVYLLHYAFLAARPLLLFAASSSFRRHVAELCVRCRCCLCCCCCRGRHKRRQTRRSSSSDGSVGGACSATSHAGTAAGGGERAADNVQPLLGGKTETSTPHTNHVTFDPNTVDLCATRGAATSASASAAIVLENDEGVRPRNTENFNTFLPMSLVPVRCLYDFYKIVRDCGDLRVGSCVKINGGSLNGLSSAAIVLENGAPCIKIFSMTSV